MSPTGRPTTTAVRWDGFQGSPTSCEWLAAATSVWSTPPVAGSLSLRSWRRSPSSGSASSRNAPSDTAGADNGARCSVPGRRLLRRRLPGLDRDWFHDRSARTDATEAMARCGSLRDGCHRLVPERSDVRRRPAIVPADRSLARAAAPPPRPAAKVAVPVGVAYLAVLANFERAVGRWTAGSASRSRTATERRGRRPPCSINFGSSPARRPRRGSASRHSSSWSSSLPARGWAPGSGTISAPGNVACCSSVPRCGCPALVLGGDLSLYRAESLLLLSVILLARLHPAAIWALAVAAIPISYNMAQLFFAYVLI